MSQYFVPDELRTETKQTEVEGITLLRGGRYKEAEQRFREQLNKFFEWQDKHKQRIHKGGPFHNLGLSLLFQGSFPEALKFLIFAYIEDMVGTEKKGGCDNYPASRVLRGICGVAQEQLRKIDGIVFEYRTENTRQKNPKLHESIFVEANPIIQEIVGNYEKFLSDTWKFEIEGQRALQSKAFATAFDIYQSWLATLIEYQNAVSMRIHKGTPFFNIGLSLFLREDEESKSSSKEWFLYAHIENSLSALIVDEIATESSSMILKTQLRVDEEVLASLGKYAFSQKGKPISLDPREVLKLYIEQNNIEIVILLLAHLPSFRKKKKVELLQSASAEQDSNKKGQLLVDLMNLMIKSDVNFDVGKVDVRTETEQIDIEVHNKAIDPFLRGINSMIIIVECKNWSKSVGSDEIRDFASKVQNRPRVLCNVGLFITTSKFTKKAIKELLRHSGKDYLIATIDGNELEKAVSRCLPFSEILKNSILSAGRR